jgi:hypothetical protein
MLQHAVSMSTISNTSPTFIFEDDRNEENEKNVRKEKEREGGGSGNAWGEGFIESQA